MPEAQVKLITSPNANIDGASDGSELVNCFLDDNNCLCKRPGWDLQDTIDATGKVDGLFYWPSKTMLVVIANGHLWVKTSLIASPSKKTTVALFTPGNRVTFATNGVWLYMADGTGKPVIWSGLVSPAPAVDTDTNAPTPCTHVGYIDGYIVGNKAGTQSWYYAEPDSTDIANKLIWNINGLSAEAESDYIKALAIGWREVFVLGTQTAESFYDEGGSTVFVRVEGGVVEQGSPAPYTLQKFNNKWIFLSHERKVVQMQDRNPVDISKKIHRIIQTLSKVDDAFADIISVSGKNWYVVTFPTSDKTFAYDLDLEYWAEWSQYSSTTDKYSRFHGNYMHRVDDWNAMLIGTRGGLLGVLRIDAFMDYLETIRMTYRSEYITHGTGNFKRSNRLTLRLKRSYDYERHSFWPELTINHEETSIIYKDEAVSRTFTIGSASLEPLITWSAPSLPGGTLTGTSTAATWTGFTPTVEGTVYSFTVTATDVMGRTEVWTLCLTVVAFDVEVVS